MRLTEFRKDQNQYFCKDFKIDKEKGLVVSVVEFNRAVVDKLGVLEDIEELCKKITTQPYYSKDSDGTISKVDDTDCAALYSFEENAIVLLYYGECSFILKINEYGKTWALTKEELK